MRSIPSRCRTWFALTILFACCAAPAAQVPEAALQLDPYFHSEISPQPLTPRLLSSTDETERPLHFSTSIQPKAGSAPVAPASRAQTLAPEPLENKTGIQRLLLRALHAFWLVCAGLLVLHLFREWLRVMHVRVNRPARAVVLEHARWPTISILIPARGSPEDQIQRLAALPALDFSYPPERIHFVPMFDPAESQVSAAVSFLDEQLPGRVHPLPMMAGPNTNLASALHAAVSNSIGSALLVLDQELPLPQDWLRKSVTPLLDPAIGCVLTRAVISPTEQGLATRLDLLADQADTLLARQNDALSLLLCGKARIRAFRRQALKSLRAPELSHAPDGASLVLDMTRLGWQTGLLGDITYYKDCSPPDLINAPRLHPDIALRSLRLAGLLLDPRIPAGARRQARAVCFSAALPLIWLASLLSSLCLYFSGMPLSAGLGVALCTACSFDPHGNPGPAFRLAAAARMAGVRDEIRLTPLAWLGFTQRLLSGIRLLTHTPRQTRREHAQAIPAPALQSGNQEEAPA